MLCALPWQGFPQGTPGSPVPLPGVPSGEGELLASDREIYLWFNCLFGIRRKRKIELWHFMHMTK